MPSYQRQEQGKETHRETVLPLFKSTSFTGHFLFFKAIMMANVDCHVESVWNHPGSKLFGMSVREFLDKVN